MQFSELWEKMMMKGTEYDSDIFCILSYKCEICTCKTRVGEKKTNENMRCVNRKRPTTLYLYKSMLTLTMMYSLSCITC